MAMNQWRKFAFFDKRLLKSESGEQLDVLQQYRILTSTCGGGKLIFGDAEGNIIVMDHKFTTSVFCAYLLRLSHLFMTKQQNILVSVGEDSEEQGSMVKVWNFDKLDAAGNPSCTRMIKISSKTNPDLVTCFVVHENLNYMAVGYSSGAVVLFKGDITKERNSGKQSVIHEGKSPITGLSFRPTTTVKGGIVLYISSVDEVWSHMIGSRDKESETLLDQHGCSLLCSTMTDSSADYQFVIGRSDALYFYLPDSRGQCLAFGGVKLLMEWSHGYLVVVSRKEESESRTAMKIDSATSEMEIITIYDVKNKLIAYYGPIQKVKAILSEWGSIFVLCEDNKLYQIREKELLQKLELLFRKNLYSLAISLAKAQQFDQDALVEMFRQYGDHLYSKGDYDEAMAQYIKTIGRLEPSYVIRQFLDAQRIHNLTSYLRALHDNSLASEDHTTLLLNCYTKLKDVEQLDKFIMAKNPNHVITFDVETAIRVLRQSEYFKHALHLAKIHRKHDWYLKIQLEDNRDYVKALDYIAKLDFASAEANMKNYGRLLMSHAPEQTAEFLKKLCTDYKPAVETADKKDEVPGFASPVELQAANPEDFFHIFVSHSRLMMDFLEFVVNSRNDLSTELHNMLLELYLETWKKSSDEMEKSGLEQKIMRILKEPNTCDPMQSLLLCQMNSFPPGILYLYEQKGMFAEILQFAMDRKDYENVVSTCGRFGAKDSHLWVQAFWFLAKNFGEFDKALIMEVLKVIETKNLLPSLMVVDILSKNPNATLDVVRDYVISRMKADEKKIKDDEAQIQQFRDKTDKIRKQVDQIKNGAQTFQDANCSACDKGLELPSVHFLCRHSYHQHCYESYADTDECYICGPENSFLLKRYPVESAVGGKRKSALEPPGGVDQKSMVDYSRAQSSRWKVVYEKRVTYLPYGFFDLKILEEIKAQEQNKDLTSQFYTRLTKEVDSFSVVAEYFGKGLFGRQTSIEDVLRPGNQ